MCQRGACTGTPATAGRRLIAAARIPQSSGGNVPIAGIRAKDLSDFEEVLDAELARPARLYRARMPKRLPVRRATTSHFETERVTRKRTVGT
jgi:hypothetical protein